MHLINSNCIVQCFTVSIDYQQGLLYKGCDLTTDSLGAQVLATSIIDKMNPIVPVTNI